MPPEKDSKSTESRTSSPQRSTMPQLINDPNPFASVTELQAYLANLDTLEPGPEVDLPRAHAQDALASLSQRGRQARAEGVAALRKLHDDLDATGRRLRKS